ncbi:sensor histidine kinase, HAMP and PAS domain-containing [Anopheles sinensis]|uniref:Sensor histidine kinase, HAMP and PAS domain-containing n=1 Tax=Anopheles sinensis TaxID=74873 RepID=A0A084V9V5_ANOSI|nr:sensor histidine kinase, HAMP and PAS domain-containing [Anopheles sinensis]
MTSLFLSLCTPFDSGHNFHSDCVRKKRKIKRHGGRSWECSSRSWPNRDHGVNANGARAGGKLSMFCDQSATFAGIGISTFGTTGSETHDDVVTLGTGSFPVGVVRAPDGEGGA